MEEINAIGRSSSQHRERRLDAAVLSLVITALAFSSLPLGAQVSTRARATSCVGPNLVSFALPGQNADNGIVASVLPSLSNFFIGVETQTLSGRLTCADPRPAFYKCGHTKQSVWGCKPDCFIEPDGTQYVLESLGRSYSVTGDPDKIRPYLTDEVTVTGKLKGETIKAVSIAKTSKSVRLSSSRSEYGTP
jgi:hypothetical protein